MVYLSLSGPDTGEDTGEIIHRRSTMNPAFAMAAMDQKSVDGNDKVFQDVVMRLAITHHLKRNASSRDLSFTSIQLTNMLQAFIDNHHEIIQYAILCNNNHPPLTSLARGSHSRNTWQTLSRICIFLWKDK